MKKFITLSIIAVLVLSMGITAFADNSKEVPEWYNDMIEWRKKEVDKAVQDGLITKEDAQLWIEHIENMEEYHNQYGFGPGMMRGYGRRNTKGLLRNNINRPGFGMGHCIKW